jgi:hypothetical protein
MEDKTRLAVKEEIVLSKYEGDGTDPATEFERITIVNGHVTNHDKIKNQKIIGPVGPEENLTGKSIGTLLENKKEVE